VAAEWQKGCVSRTITVTLKLLTVKLERIIRPVAVDAKNNGGHSPL
jgi:hypothetical protein